jgi:hypothetical protein
MKKIFFIAALAFICSFSMLRPGYADIEWTIKKQLQVDAAPTGVALTQDGKWMFVLTSKEVIIYETKGDKILTRIPLEKPYDTLSYSDADNTILLSSRSEKAIKVIGIDTVHQFSLSGLPIKGPENAPVTIAVFSDYQ